MTEHSLINELCDTLNQLIEKLISNSVGLIESFEGKIHLINERLTSHNDTLQNLRVKKELFLSQTESQHPESEFEASVNECISDYKENSEGIYSSTEKLLVEFKNLKENLVQGLTSIKKNISLILQGFRSQVAYLNTRNSSLETKINQLETSLAEYQKKYSSLELKLDQIKNAYESLNRNYDELEYRNRENQDKINNLTRENQALEKNIQTFQNSMNRIKINYLELYDYLQKFPNKELKLPANIIKKDVEAVFDESRLERLFRSIRTIVDLDLELTSLYEKSRAFNEALLNNYYSQILIQEFKGISDIEDKEYNALTQKIGELEGLINNPQQSRYMHTELFEPYLKTARVLLGTHREKTAKACSKLIETIRDKLEDNEFKRLLIRRTGVRHLGLEDCHILSHEIPLDLDNIDESMNNLLNALNIHINEKQRELSLKFFEVWRDAAESLRVRDEIGKIAAYSIMLTTNKILDKIDRKDSELRRLFRKGLILI